MNVIRAAKELQNTSRKVSLAIGFFDGVHLGHQQIIRQTIADARAVNGLSLVVTFDVHPSVIVNPAHAPALIYPLPQKLRVIESLGADALLLVHFDKAFSEQSGELFIRNLARDPGKIHSICVGADFTFGHKRSGNVDLLKQLGAELGFTVHGMSAVSLDDRAVSSTRIRETIRAGLLDDASQMLGRAYSICGKVIRGDQIGRKLGFPTANLDCSGLVLPPPGVYTVNAKVGQQTHPAVVNIGARPTVAAGLPKIRVEAHLLDFNGDLYDQDIELLLGQKIRDEFKFPNLDALKGQIARDIAQARSLLLP
jgi:riboflavin kinase/FMN adenylyltransferase